MNYKGIELAYRGMKDGMILVDIVSTDKAMRNKAQTIKVDAKHFKPEKECELKEGENIDYVFRRAPQCLVYAGYLEPIQGIVRRATLNMIIENEKKKQSESKEAK